MARPGTDDVGGSAKTVAESQLQTTSSPNRGEPMPNHMAHLWQPYEAQDFSQGVAECIISSWQGNTNVAYNSTWVGWCTRRGFNPSIARARLWEATH